MSRTRPMCDWIQTMRALLAAFAVAGALVCAAGAAEPLRASQAAAELDRQIDWSAFRLIAVQDAGRYKTMDSFAREAFSGMYSRESLPGLSPAASLCDWLFRRADYVDSPVVRVRDKGLRVHFSAHMADAPRERIVNTGYMTPRELADPTVRGRMDELETNTIMKSAMNRAREAQFYAEQMERALRIVPSPAGDATMAWHTVDELQANLPDDVLVAAGLTRFGVGPRIPHISEEAALRVMGPWARLKRGWLANDAAAVQAAVNDLAAALPAIAGPGIYPAEAQRRAEARYYAMGKFTWGYVLYAIAGVLSIWALITGWRFAYGLTALVTLLAMGVHAYGLGLRWSILGRIPVANMFEAVVASAWGGVAIALLLELVYRRRFFLVAANFVGFLSLVLGAFVIPGHGTLTSIMGILDDVMLRIHTVLIILSYALIALAAVIAVVYLFGYYLVRAPQRSISSSLIVAIAGAILWPLLTYWVYATPMALDGTHPPRPHARDVASLVTVCTLVLSAFAWILPRGVRFHSVWLAGTIAFCGALVWLTPSGFAQATAMIMLIAGTVWAAATLIARTAMRAATGDNEAGGYAPSGVAPAAMAMAGAAAGSASVASAMNAGAAGDPAAAIAMNPSGGGVAGRGPMSAAAVLRSERPILAGAAPGDEGSPLPTWLHHADWCHLIILNMVVVMLFVGTILGAVWADYSWGRPWGWDPKEVFAMNTWIVYAILIHVRFITKNRGLWTAWLSVAGTAMMAFNWCFVNFFIVGLHSYA
jgi:ABC-type transport system involved in cytochrome c biogenesis permease subunit